MNSKLKYISLLVLTSLWGCSNNLGVSTNLDKKNFKEYFAVGSVLVLESEEQLSSNHVFVGLVEGESCQVNANDVPANASDARTDARKKAAKLNANAIVVTSCVTIDDNQCNELLVCYAKAFNQSQQD